MNIKILLSKNTWLIVALAIIISFIYPNTGLMLAPYIGYLLMMLMFLSCLDVEMKQIVEQTKNWKKYTVIFLIVHLLSPLIIFSLKPILDPDIFLGLLMTSAMPSGMSIVFLSCLYCYKEGSNRFFSMFGSVLSSFLPAKKGVASKALFLTTISHILSPLLVPLVVFVLARSVVQIDYLAITIMIVKFVIVPIVVAKLVGFTKIKKQLSNYSSSISVLLLFVIMIGVISPVQTIIMSNLVLSAWLSLLVFVLITINFFAGWFIGESREEKITFGLASSYKNFTLATVLALSLFSPIVALPAIVYAVMNNFFLIPLQLIFLKLKKK